jgi:hypothetical protein
MYVTPDGRKWLLRDGELVPLAEVQRLDAEARKARDAVTKQQRTVERRKKGAAKPAPVLAVVERVPPRDFHEEMDTSGSSLTECAPAWCWCDMPYANFSEMELIGCLR